MAASIHAQRVDVARRWLKAMGDLPAFEASPLAPHSPAWFEALGNWSPAQAQMTKWLIDRTGRADICSVCGEDPAADYRIAPDQQPPGGPIRSAYVTIASKSGALPVSISSY